MRDINFDNINFLNENILISTKNGREKMKEYCLYMDKVSSEWINNLSRLGPIIIPTAKKILTMDSDKIADYLQKPSTIEKLDNTVIEYKTSCNKLVNTMNESLKNYKYIKEFINPFYQMKFKKVLNKADLRDAEVAPELNEFIKKCSDGGQYIEALKRINDRYNITDLYKQNINRIENNIKPVMNQNIKANKSITEFMNCVFDFLNGLDYIEANIKSAANNFNVDNPLVLSIKFSKKFSR